MSHNIQEQGQDLGNLASGCFDAVLLDAPCSAEGNLRKHPEVPKPGTYWGLVGNTGIYCIGVIYLGIASPCSLLTTSTRRRCCRAACWKVLCRLQSDSYQETVRANGELQWELLQSAWKLLRPGLREGERMPCTHFFSV